MKKKMIKRKGSLWIKLMWWGKIDLEFLQKIKEGPQNPQKREKKIEKVNESDPDSSTVEMEDSEEIISEENDEEKKLLEKKHPQLLDSIKSQNTEKEN